MGLIPTYCGACSSWNLTVTTKVNDGRCKCLDCGKEALTVPGLGYGDKDSTLYQTLANALWAAGINRVDARQLLKEVDTDTLLRSPGQIMNKVSLALPSIAPLAVLTGDGLALRTAEGMLITLLAAHAVMRRKSERSSGAPAEAPAKRAVGE